MANHLRVCCPAYRIGIQDSSGFSLLYNRHPRKGIEHELRIATDGLQCEVDAESTNTMMEKLLDVMKQYHDKARNNIQSAQKRQKEYYDAKQDSKHVSD